MHNHAPQPCAAIGSPNPQAKSSD
ncbi:Protein of unknown function [Propionibacterium freudenreichii]|nr:Protein of unknown function [Propionibacterium freudenreichii subsp. freudenreichii]CEG85667.1 Protein of unknown function [Propionibacterium freudenreichii]CEG88661.1 Protein of unknown function [Propionibacterium freudenreichii]CEG96426.1 Protein of unknown function [Propionibacterium freudenreichii]CEG98436.1 Protein of unknown function [Propionibacterium freudenreichii]